MKKIIGLTLVLVLVAGVLPLGALASGEPGSVVLYAEGTEEAEEETGEEEPVSTAEEPVPEEDPESPVLDGPEEVNAPAECGDFRYYGYEDGTAEIVEYTGEDGEVVIPSELDGYTVTAIGSGAFFYETIRSVVIPDTVTEIGGSAFESCAFLNSVDLGSGVRVIGDWAFSECISLLDIVLPDSVEEIGMCAFRDSSRLRTISFGDSVSSVGAYAFYGCGSLKEISLPDSVEEIGTSGFGGCSALESVDLGSGLKTIGDWAFEDCVSLESFVIPNRVTTIGEYAFYGCDGLKTLVIGSSVNSVGEGAFEECGALENIVFLGRAPSVGSYAFDADSAVVYYPAENSSWTQEAIDGINDRSWCDLTWIGYGDLSEIPEEILSGVDIDSIIIDDTPVEPDHLPGDINDDGTVNISDVQTLLKFVNGQDVDVVNDALDVNGDEAVNISDVQTLLKFVNGQDVEIV